MRNKLLIVAFLMSVLSTSAYSWTNISFGNKDNQVRFKEANGPEDFITGPNAFRIYNGNLWVADSVNGRVICFDKAGKLIRAINVAGLSKSAYIADFALQFSKGSVKPEAIWVAEQTSVNIIKSDMTGKTILKIDNKSGTLQQADEIDCDSQGRVYVGDIGAAAIVAYSADGKFQRKIRWNMSGFVIDNNDNLHTIGYSKEVGNKQLVYSADGKLISQVALGYKKMQNPRIWAIDKTGNMLVSLIPPSGNPTAQQIIMFNSKGKSLETRTFKSPYYINRYVIVGSQNIWVIKANYAKAPKSQIRISKISN